MPMHLETERHFVKHLLRCLCLILKGSFTPNYLTTVLEIVVHQFLQSSLHSFRVHEDPIRLPSAHIFHRSPPVTVLLSSVTPDSLAAYELSLGLNTAQLKFNHCDFTEAAPFWHSISNNEIQPLIQICTQPCHNSVAPGFSSLHRPRGLPKDSASDTGTTFNNSPTREKAMLFWEWFRGNSVIPNSPAQFISPAWLSLWPWARHFDYIRTAEWQRRSVPANLNSPA